MLLSFRTHESGFSSSVAIVVLEGLASSSCIVVTPGSIDGVAF